MIQIKICGISNLADARFAAGAGADFLGFVQHPDSPRYIEPRKAREIIDWVYGAKPVGVFVNRRPDDINVIAAEAGFQYVQLHGDESPDVCREIDFPVIKAIRVRPEWTAADIESAVQPFADVVEYVLFDTWDAALYGGTGTPFDWSVLANASLPVPCFLAGGLTPDTVAAAISACAPFAVDVSSGVEEAPGQKDYGAISAFVEAVRP